MERMKLCAAHNTLFLDLMFLLMYIDVFDAH